MAKLIILRGEQHKIYELKDAVVTCGRAPDNGLWLDDPSLSRRHCEFRKAGSGFAVKDLGSFNGTFCNSVNITDHTLKPGDRINIGQSTLYYIPSDEEIGAAAPAAAAPAGSAEAAAQATARKMRNFAALLETTKAVNSEKSGDALLEIIIDKAVELTQADRGFLIMFDEQKQRVFKVARKRDKSRIENPERLISRTVVSSVTETGEPVMTIDAQKDLGGMSTTIASLEIRSLLCAPLRVKDKILGCVYVDSHIAEQEFGDEALNLLQALCDQAAVAIERQRLFDEVMQSRENEKHVRQMFQKYVPADVVRKALEMKDGGRLSAKQVATVLFSDIRSFTSISEKMPPESVVSFLNDYLQRMVEIVFESGGIVDKFIGDAVMAVFGAPVVRPDDAQRAVKAAVKMLEELENFNRDQATKGTGVNIRIGVGVHTGPLIAGNIGSDRKMEYTVIGDTVNLASRVQDLNKDFKTEIIITQGCLDATDGTFPVRPLDVVKVKGKEQGVQIYQVLWQQMRAGQPITQSTVPVAAPQPLPPAPPPPAPAPAHTQAARPALQDTGPTGVDTFDIEL